MSCAVDAVVNDKYASDAPDADGSHWACARYDVRQRRLYAFDSLADARSENAPAAFFKKLVRQLTILFDGPVKLVPVRFESQENSTLPFFIGSHDVRKLKKC